MSKPRVEPELLRSKMLAGKTDKAIGREVGMANRSVAYWRKKLGIAPTPRRSPDAEKVRTALLAGRTDADIGREMKFHTSSIRRLRERFKIEVPQATAKQCSGCKRALPAEMFSRREGAESKSSRTRASNDIKNVHSRCKDCRAKTYREYCLKRYGASQGYYEKVLIAQQHRCAICKESEEEQIAAGKFRPVKANNRKHRFLCLDHDHKTTTARGLLCLRCNAGIGSFLDNPALMRAAAEYLERHA